MSEFVLWLWALGTTTTAVLALAMAVGAVLRLQRHGDALAAHREWHKDCGDPAGIPEDDEL